MKQLYLGRLGQAMAKDCRPLSFSQHRRGLHTFFIPYLEPCPNIPQICWQILLLLKSGPSKCSSNMFGNFPELPL